MGKCVKSKDTKRTESEVEDQNLNGFLLFHIIIMSLSFQFVWCPRPLPTTNPPCPYFFSDKVILVLNLLIN